MTEVIETNEPTEKNRECPVFQFDMKMTEPHYNADTLRTFKIPGTDYNYCLKELDWDNYQGRVSWIQPESLVDTTLPQFDWLAGEKSKYDHLGYKQKDGKYALVKAKRLRGLISYGLLVKVDDSYEIGSDASERLGVIHWNPPEVESGGSMAGGDAESPPAGVYSKYDISNGFGRDAKGSMIDGELCGVSEKLHGCFAGYIYTGDKMYAKSRTEFKKEFSTPPDLTVEKLIERGVEKDKAEAIYQAKVVNHKPERNSIWWQALPPEVEKFCKENPDWRVYGEVYGQVQKGFVYGLQNGKNSFAAFDIMRPDGSYLNVEDFLATCAKHNIKTVPVIATNWPFNLEEAKVMSDGKSTLSENTIKEGIVIKPMTERRNNRIGRVFVKVISPTYSEK